MLAATLSELYAWGGAIWMHPITLLLIINIAIFIYVLFSLSQKKQFNSNWLSAIKQIAGLAVAWGTFSTLAGLFQAFDALENSQDIIPFQVIMGGLKVALITALYGLLVFCISQLAYIILKLIARQPG
jgi:flagellar motor component MotA